MAAGGILQQHLLQFTITIIWQQGRDLPGKAAGFYENHDWIVRQWRSRSCT
jgi:hypothetical protein